MAKTGSPTPERELLKLIEGKTPEMVQVQRLRHQGLSFLSISAWIGRISFLKTLLRDKFYEIRSQPFDIKFLNKVLCLLIFILSLYFFISLFSIFKQFKNLPSVVNLAKEEIDSLDTSGVLLLKNPSSYYVNKARERDIFRMGKIEKDTQEVKSVSRGPSSKIIEATQHLRLVGISWSSDPDAMIEDTKAMRTFFIKRGQKIGDVKVEAIFKDKVILSYEGEEIELR